MIIVNMMLTTRNYKEYFWPTSFAMWHSVLCQWNGVFWYVSLLTFTHLTMVWLMQRFTHLTMFWLMQRVLVRVKSFCCWHCNPITPALPTHASCLMSTFLMVWMLRTISQGPSLHHKKACWYWYRSIFLAIVLLYGGLNIAKIINIIQYSRYSSNVRFPWLQNFPDNCRTDTFYILWKQRLGIKILNEIKKKY